MREEHCKDVSNVRRNCKAQHGEHWRQQDGTPRLMKDIMGAAALGLAVSNELGWRYGGHVMRHDGLEATI